MIILVTTANITWKVSRYGVFSGLYFPAFGMNSEWYSWALLYGFIYMMQKVNFGYSINNIPIPSKRTCLLQLMEKVEMVITRMRWKAIHFSNNNNNSIDNNKEENTEWYGLKPLYSPTWVKEHITFKNDLVELIRNIKFRNIRNSFLEKLKEDIKIIKVSHNIREQDLQWCLSKSRRRVKIWPFYNIWII